MCACILGVYSLQYCARYRQLYIIYERISSHIGITIVTAFIYNEYDEENDARAQCFCIVRGAFVYLFVHIIKRTAEIVRERNSFGIIIILYIGENVSFG